MFCSSGDQEFKYLVEQSLTMKRTNLSEGKISQTIRQYSHKASMHIDHTLFATGAKGTTP